MHSSSFESGRECQRDGGDILVTIAALVTEGRIPEKINKSRGFQEGPHCPPSKHQPTDHSCNPTDSLCQKYETVQNQILNLWKNNIPVCIEVHLVPACGCHKDNPIDSPSNSLFHTQNRTGFMLEQWHLSVSKHRPSEASSPFNLNQLISAVRSQLYFSQISAWLSSQDDTKTKLLPSNFRYSVGIPGETFKTSIFNTSVSKHQFPTTDLGNGLTLNVTLISIPRLATVPSLNCLKCTPVQTKTKDEDRVKKESPRSRLFDDRMHTLCTLKGKHRCEDLDDFDVKKDCKFAKRCNPQESTGEPSTSKNSKFLVDTNKATLYYQYKEKKRNQANEKIEKRCCSVQDQSAQKTPKLDLHEIRDVLKVFDRIDLSKQQQQQEEASASSTNLLSAIWKSRRLQDDGKDSTKSSSDDSQEDDQKQIHERPVRKTAGDDCCQCDTKKCESDKKISLKENHKRDNNNIYVVDNNCDKLVSLRSLLRVGKARQRIDFDGFPSAVEEVKGCGRDEEKVEVKVVQAINQQAIDVPSSVEQAKFKKSLDNAASMVFHSRTGLPLTSSPAPVRRGKCFDFDSSINSVSAIKSALYADTADEDSESDGSIISPRSPDTYAPPTFVPPAKCHVKRHASNLLGTFEESVLNGRLEPVSTVHGFKAELGASGAFIPKHSVVPVTVFFYTLGDNDKISSPYLGHINLGKKGYNVPPRGTLQVTLYNPSGTVVKMFVVMYDLSDMPPNSKTFIRQRTWNIPNNYKNSEQEMSPKWLRYLIHLRFMSSKSGRIYLHSDIRLVISRKSDLDTAAGHGDSMHELRSFTHMPTNPKYTSIK